MSTISGFTIFPVVYAQDATHFLYGKAHDVQQKVGEDSFPQDRTLFVVNVPPDATGRELSLFFNHYGTVEDVVFNDSNSSMHMGHADEMQEDDTPTSTRVYRETGKTAYITFLDESSLKTTLSHPKKLPWKSSSEPHGVAHYRSLYDSMRPDLDVVRERANAALAAYDKSLAEKKKSQNTKGNPVVDEDGFTLVGRAGRPVIVAEPQQDKDKNRKKKGEKKEGFYAFQHHEKKRKELLDLKARWEQDKSNVAKLRETRRFKPY